MLDTLHAYLAPLVIAVPLAIVVLLVALRRDDAPKDLGRPAPPAPRPAGAGPAADGSQARVALAPTPRHAPPAPLGGAVPPAFPLPPTVPAPAEPPAVAAAARPAPAGPPAVLVVDDSAVVRTKLQRLLEGAGFTVVVARDGEEALARLEEQSYAVLITDLEMPRLDGFGLIAAVQGAMATENLPIVAITGHDEMHTRVADLGGLYGLFKKPWNDRELLRRVQTLAALGGGPIFEARPGG